MSRKLVPILLILALGLPVAIAGADELVEAAKKERARREALKKNNQKPLVLSNTGLKKAAPTKGTVSEVTPHHELGSPEAGAGPAGPAGVTEGSGEAAAGQPGDGAAAKTAAKPATAPPAAAAGASTGGDEAAWRARMTEAREAVTKAEAHLAELTQKVNDLRRMSSAADDPNVRYRSGQDQRAAETDLSAAQQAVIDARKGIENVRSEARRAGAPAGWLR